MDRRVLFCWRVRVLWQVGAQESSVSEAEEGDQPRPSHHIDNQPTTTHTSLLQGTNRDANSTFVSPAGCFLVCSSPLVGRHPVAQRFTPQHLHELLQAWEPLLRLKNPEFSWDGSDHSRPNQKKSFGSHFCN